jgi:hypothetical protein
VIGSSARWGVGGGGLFCGGGIDRVGGLVRCHQLVLRAWHVMSLSGEFVLGAGGYFGEDPRDSPGVGAALFRWTGSFVGTGIR